MRTSSSENCLAWAVGVTSWRIPISETVLGAKARIGNMRVASSTSNNERMMTRTWRNFRIVLTWGEFSNIAMQQDLKTPSFLSLLLLFAHLGARMHGSLMAGSHHVNIPNSLPNTQ